MARPAWARLDRPSPKATVGPPSSRCPANEGGRVRIPGVVERGATQSTPGSPTRQRVGWRRDAAPTECSRTFTTGCSHPGDAKHVRLVFRSDRAGGSARTRILERGLFGLVDNTIPAPAARVAVDSAGGHPHRSLSWLGRRDSNAGGALESPGGRRCSSVKCFRQLPVLCLLAPWAGRAGRCHPGPPVRPTPDFHHGPLALRGALLLGPHRKR